MNISGHTKIVALLGHPVSHSLSPRMHNAAFEALGMDYCYVTFAVRHEHIGDAVRAVRALGLAGVNVTVPHKEAVIAHLDKVNEEAKFIGAVNTIVNKEGKLTGYNTDGRGFMKSLQEEGISVEGKKVMIVGTGGACRAIGYYLSQKSESLYLYDIDNIKAGKLAYDLGKKRGNVHIAHSTDFISEVDVVVNATPLGLKETDPMPFDPALLKPGAVVGDLIYKETPLLKAAKDKGLKAFSGLGMLLWQGAIAFELWTGAAPPVDVMRNALIEVMKR